MDNFKEAYQDDLANAFFDEEEFASRHTIDGVECTVILTECTNSTLPSSRLRYALNPKETAIDKVSHILYIQDTEAERLKRTKFTGNARIDLDGKKYFVQDVRHADGMYRLAIGIHSV